MIKKLSNDDAEKNLGMKVQPNGCNIRHLKVLKDKGNFFSALKSGRPDF